MKKFILGAVALSCLSITGVVVADDHSEVAPRNMIIVVGDGMGFPYTTAYRYFKDGRGMTTQADIEPTLLDRYLVGAASTYPADDTLITDSAASATTLASRVKTYNGAIGVDIEKSPVESLMETAKAEGFLTGAIATTRVTHATPAAFFTHVHYRRQEREIAEQFAQFNEDGEWKFDLLLGSGREFFRYENEDGTQVDHLADMQSRGMQVIESIDGLTDVRALPLTGLFHEKDFPFVIDDAPRLEQMVAQGLRLLAEQDEPFVLLIEASMIDWCGHGNDIGCAMHEMRDLELAFDTLVEFVESRSDTALVMTADHSTGGLALGADGVYQWRAAQVNRIGRSLRLMANELAAMAKIDWEPYINQYLPFPLATEHQSELNRLAALTGESQVREINKFLVQFVRYHTGTGFTTSGHTGEDVPVYAVGPWADAFRGHQDHSDIAAQLIEWIEARD
ncbi:MAG: alkaline phosphatase PhoB [Idiomarinaceae bacterium HL-53]|nr:MAG: alkaline phosphatase PhoB [Idiomarinaceae bacterium HL-53]CUS47239.1 alkaline phosphatase [Idiomarinaceae bacterium HL-53]